MRRLAAVVVVAGCSGGAPASSAPATAPTSRGTPADSIAVGGAQACFVARGGAVICWGDGNPTPAPVADVPAATAIAIGEEHACALTVDKTVWCWGDPEHGATARASGTEPAAVAIDDVVEIGASENATCARRADGSVSCWGTLAHDGTRIATPHQVIAGDAMDLEVASWDACARMRGGDVRCWSDTGATPTVVAGAGDGTLTCGGGHCCVLGATGALTCWGGVPAGYMIQGSFTITEKPTPVTWLDPMTSLWASGRADCGARRDGSIFCWGDPGSDELRDAVAAPFGTGTYRWEQPGLTAVRALALSDGFGCALSSGGTVSCWGSDNLGQLGDGHADDDGRSEPAPIAW
jgi:alpha-tubulin suppressor-like RCC1 family protein